MVYRLQVVSGTSGTIDKHTVPYIKFRSPRANRNLRKACSLNGRILGVVFPIFKVRTFGIVSIVDLERPVADPDLELGVRGGGGGGRFFFFFFAWPASFSSFCEFFFLFYPK